MILRSVPTATVTVTGKNKYTGSFEKTFNILKGSVADATVTGIKDKTYTGKALTQKPVVKLSDNTLADGTDYREAHCTGRPVQRIPYRDAQRPRQFLWNG